MTSHLSDPITNKKLYLETNLQIIFCITLIAIMGVASLTPVFPKVIEVFQISSQAVGLLITVFTLPGVFLTPILGVLAAPVLWCVIFTCC